MCAVPARGRLVWAAAGSLMLHAVGLAVLWRTLVPHSVLPAPSQVPPPAMLWVALAPAPAPAPAPAFAVPGETDKAAGRAPQRQEPEGLPQRPSSGRCRETRAPSMASPALSAPEAAVVAMPGPPASAAQPQAAPGPDAVVRALERERAWQRRQGRARAPQSWGDEAAIAMGAGTVVRDRAGPGGSRTTKVSGPWATIAWSCPPSTSRRPWAPRRAWRLHVPVADVIGLLSPDSSRSLVPRSLVPATPGQARGVTPCLSH